MNGEDTSISRQNQNSNETSNSNGPSGSFSDSPGGPDSPGFDEGLCFPLPKLSVKDLKHLTNREMLQSMVIWYIIYNI